MKEQKDDFITVIDLRYSLAQELRDISEEDMLVWRQDHEETANTQRGSIELLQEMYDRTGSKLYSDSMKTLQRAVVAHEALARLPNPYQITQEAQISPNYHIIFWHQ